MIVFVYNHALKKTAFFKCRASWGVPTRTGVPKCYKLLSVLSIIIDLSSHCKKKKENDYVHLLASKIYIAPLKNLNKTL